VKIEKSAIPGADHLISLIGKHQKKNTIILALIISVCLVMTLYSLGFIDMLRAVTNSLTSSENNNTVPPIVE